MFKGALFRPDIFDLQHRMCATDPPQLLLLMRVMASRKSEGCE
jgi:hypothetical protein